MSVRIGVNNWIPARSQCVPISQVNCLFIPRNVFCYWWKILSNEYCNSISIHTKTTRTSSQTRRNLLHLPLMTRLGHCSSDFFNSSSCSCIPIWETRPRLYFSLGLNKYWSKLNPANHPSERYLYPFLHFAVNLCAHEHALAQNANALLDRPHSQTPEALTQTHWAKFLSIASLLTVFLCAAERSHGCIKSDVYDCHFDFSTHLYLPAASWALFSLPACWPGGWSVCCSAALSVVDFVACCLESATYSILSLFVTWYLGNVIVSSRKSARACVCVFLCVCK